MKKILFACLLLSSPAFAEYDQYQSGMDDARAQTQANDNAVNAANQYQQQVQMDNMRMDMERQQQQQADEMRRQQEEIDRQRANSYNSYR